MGFKTDCNNFLRKFDFCQNNANLKAVFIDLGRKNE